MKKSIVIWVLVAFLLLTTLTFAGLFAWQWLRNAENGASESDSSSAEIASCPSYPDPQPIDFGKHQEFTDLFKKLEMQISNLVDEKSLPSAVANLVYLDQIVWSGYYGRVEKNSTVKPDQNTMYRIGSVSKVLPAIYLFKLWEEGKLGLNDALTKYAPEFSIGRPYGSTTPISLLDIASQTSGLPSSMKFDRSDIWSAIRYNGTLEDALENLRSDILVAEPRTKCAYRGDLAKLSMSFLETSTTILKHETIVEMLRPRLTCRDHYFANYTGSPWEMYSVDSYLVVTKHGGIPGYSSFMAMVPDLKLSLNLMISGSASELFTARHALMSDIIPVFRDFLRKQEPKLTPTPDPQKYTGFYALPPQYPNISISGDGILYLEDPYSPFEKFRKVGLSYVSEGVLSMVILGGEFPCVYQSLANLDMWNGALLHFRNATNGKYNEFDAPEVFAYGFTRIQP